MSDQQSINSEIVENVQKMEEILAWILYQTDSIKSKILKSHIYHWFYYYVSERVSVEFDKVETSNTDLEGENKDFRRHLKENEAELSKLANEIQVLNCVARNYSVDC